VGEISRSTSPIKRQEAVQSLAGAPAQRARRDCAKKDAANVTQAAGPVQASMAGRGLRAGGAVEERAGKVFDEPRSASIDRWPGYREDR